MENDVLCTVIVPIDDATPVWFPAFFPSINDAFVIGHKGHRGILKIPTRQGYVHDKYGLSCNLMAIRFNDKKPIFSFGKFILYKYPTVSNNMIFVCVGDSITRFLLHERGFTNNMVRISAQGRALVEQVQTNLCRISKYINPFVIFIHAGVNNLSKEYLYNNEYQQMCIAKNALLKFSPVLLQMCAGNRKVQVVSSSIIKTKDDNINIRATVHNKITREMCIK